MLDYRLAFIGIQNAQLYHLRTNVAYNTYQMYSNALQNHINPVLGDMLLRNVKTIQIQQLINQLIEKGNNRSAKIVRLTVKQFMHQALLENNILFTMNNGIYMTKSSFRKFWERIVSAVKEQAENPNDITFTPHIFRHTYATNLYYAGVDIKTAQYFLGHSSLSMTLEIYTHLDKQHINGEIDKLNKYLVSQKSVNG